MTTGGVSRRAWLAGVGALAAGCGHARSREDGFAVGYVTNITHAQPIVGAMSGAWAKAIGPGTRMVAFPAGPAVMEALNAGSIDAGFLGPTAMINGFVRSKGRRLRLLSGAASGGASLVARAGLGIRSASDLRGRKVTASLIGSTPDVSLRAYLDRAGLTPSDRGGDVTLIPMANAEAFALLKRGHLQACWAQEPWASRMVAQAGCERVLDERELWPNRAFPTSLLVASRRGLEVFPGELQTLVSLLHDETRRMRANDSTARDEVASALAKMLGKRLPDELLHDAWSRFEVTNDPLLDVVATVASDMRKMGYLPEGSLEGLMAQGITTTEVSAG